MGILDASEAIRYLPLGLMKSNNGSGDSWGPVGPPGIASLSPHEAHFDREIAYA